MIRVYVLFVALCFVSLSCTQEREPCLTPKIASFNIVCVHHTTDTSTVPIDTALPAAEWGALTQAGIKTVIYPQSSTFTLSLASNADSCTWLFTTDSSFYHTDTLKFYYKRELQFLSNACGFAYFYSLDTFYTTHFNIDSAKILARGVTNDISTTQFEIFIHPDY